MEFTYLQAPQKFAMIAKTMGENIEGLSVEEAAARSIDDMKRLFAKLDMTPRLRDYGVMQEHFRLVSCQCVKNNENEYRK